MMKIVINKSVCHILFIHHLARWHFSSRQYFREYWSKIPNPLNKNESQLLKIYGEYSQNKLNDHKILIIDKFFKKNLNKKDKQILKLLYAATAERFEFHFKQQVANMRKISDWLKKLNLKAPKKIIENLYDINTRMPIIYLTLSYNANSHAGGMMSEGRVILEFGDWIIKKDNSSIINVLLHEITHAGSLKKLIRKTDKFSLPPWHHDNYIELLDEIIHHSLASEVGLVSQELFNWSEQEIKEKISPRKTRSHPKDMRYFLTNAYKIRPLVKEYLIFKGQFDRNFIDRVVKLIDLKTQKSTK